jgi:hypothetical protein
MVRKAKLVVQESRSFRQTGLLCELTCRARFLVAKCRC